MNICQSLEIKPFAEQTQPLELPLADGGVKAGFPSPAQDFMENGIDLNRELIKNPSSTFFARVKGASMVDAGISDGDLLVIDKSLEPREKDIAVCFIDGEFTLKRIHFDKKEVWLMPANKEYEPIRVTEESGFRVWGVVTHTIKNYLKRQ